MQPYPRLRALVAADANPPGFEADGVYARALNLEAEGLLEAERALPVLDRMTEAIGQLAEVQSVSVASDLPMDLGRTTTGVLPEGVDPDGGWMSVDQAYVGPEYFETLGIPVEAGRYPPEIRRREEGHIVFQPHFNGGVIKRLHGRGILHLQPAQIIRLVVMGVKSANADEENLPAHPEHAADINGIGHGT